MNRWHAKNVALTNQNQQAQGRVHQQPVIQFFLDDDDANLDKNGASGANFLHPLAPRVKFNITSIMIQLLDLKVFFGGLPSDDPNMNLVNFINSYKSFNYPGVGQNAICLRLFQLSLSWEELCG